MVSCYSKQILSPLMGFCISSPGYTSYQKCQILLINAFSSNRTYGFRFPGIGPGWGGFKTLCGHALLSLMSCLFIILFGFKARQSRTSDHRSEGIKWVHEVFYRFSGCLVFYQSKRDMKYMNKNVYFRYVL